ncbi:MAG: phosphogluconate dehydrogenase (NAD(+)-dependent, decarboxylating), partial [Gaiellaceae bacterium]
GLGRMGAGLTARLRKGGHEVVGYDRNPDVSEVATLGDLAAKLGAPRTVWVMVPAGEATEQTLDALADLLEPGDIVIDGGNAYFRDTIRRAEALAEAGIELLDVGTSGGVWGLERGFCLMVGGSAAAFAHVEPALETLAPSNGYAHVGPSGAGHFVKMVHNGIEYGMLQAYAEGFEILEASKVYPDLDLHQVAEVWRHGSVVASWLLDLTERALKADPKLASISGYVPDSGEGRWTILEAISEDVPANVIAAALFARFASRQDDSFAMKMIAALRNQFGGHEVKPSAD